MNPVKKATLKLLKLYDKNKGKKIKTPTLDSPEKYFKAIKRATNEGLAKIANMRFKG